MDIDVAGCAAAPSKKDRVNIRAGRFSWLTFVDPEASGIPSAVAVMAQIMVELVGAPGAGTHPQRRIAKVQFVISRSHEDAAFVGYITSM